MADPVILYGWVTGRWLSTRTGETFDPRNGWVQMTPVPDTRHETGEGGDPATVLYRRVSLAIDDTGRIGARRVPAGRWAVSFTLSVGRLPGFEVEVTEAHTETDPLDLTEAAPVIVPPMAVEVTRVEERQRAEDAAETAVSARDETLSARDVTVTARDETVAAGIQIDTTAGTLVTVGGHVVSYDSGWRVLPASMTPNVVSGEIRIKRTRDLLLFDVRSVVLSEHPTTITLFSSLPTGWRTMDTRSAAFITETSGSRPEHYVSSFDSRATWVAAFERHLTTRGTFANNGNALSGAFTLIPRDPPPTSLIGTPV